MLDPMTAALISGASNVLGSAVAPRPAAPANSGSSAGQSSDVRQTFDFGGWTVATGSAKAEGGDSGLNLPPWLILGGLFLVSWAWVKRGKR